MIEDDNMSVKLITYDLNQPGQKHQKVVEKIKDYGKWARLSESSYAVDTASSAIFEDFKPLLDQNDHFLVVAMSKPFAGRQSNEVLDWLRNRL